MKYHRSRLWIVSVLLLAFCIVTGYHGAIAVTPTQYQAVPIIGATSEPPLVMLVLGRNHKLYYEAYNDASDLNEDGVLDVGYNPAIEYYGYFDSYKVYTYDSGDKRFEPLRTTADKKVNPAATDEWSGDYLNYLTMSRMDAIRKVLYGGYRSTDTATETVLERAYIPQDAHSWGKEYESIAKDGYDIREYTPLDLPAVDTRHLFANTTLSDAGEPLLRVLDNSKYRIWEWVSIERPVAGTKCDDGTRSDCETGGGDSWEIVPEDAFTGLTQTTYDLSAYNSFPLNHAEYDNVVAAYAFEDNKFGSGDASTINGSGNPFGSNDNYLTIFQGEIIIPADGTYNFGVDGDDALELLIDGVVVASWYGGHGQDNSPWNHDGNIYLTAGIHNITFRHNEKGGGDSYYLYWQTTTSSSNMEDYVVRVKVGANAMPEKNCKLYTNETTGATVYKPIGLLQRYGETERMYFGLMTGSYKKNTSGGVLRKNIGDIQDEINPDTGQFTAVNGIIQTINKFRIVDFDYGSHSYNSNCGWVATRAINEGECRMWGNPIGEMMYETLRYFAGKGGPTSEPTAEFSYGADGGYDDNELGLPKPDWQDPYDTYPYCSKPFMLVLSDINPTYDSDQLPGSYFGGITGDLSGLDVEELADIIGTNEGESGTFYIGQEGATRDGACTPKAINGLGRCRGLCPEEPTKKGSYYSASVAYYGHTTDMSSVTDDQLVNTFAVGLASPLPRIEIPIGDNLITLVPFAKSVGGYGISADQDDFQPTNTIVDFYVETIEPTHGKFRINYEDVEQGADHDMDAITIYEYQVVDNTGNPVDDPALGVSVKIKLTSEYAYGSIIQHSGYIISGTTQDGTYLEVRDKDTGASSDPDYFLDTPPGELPGGNWDDNTALPLVSDERQFIPYSEGDSRPAELLKNPLWYAGKWGGFEDQNDNGLPDLDTEWDTNNDTIPDNYFYVTNPLRLEEQLNASFAQIAARSASGTSASVLATTNEGEGTLIQAYFRPVTETQTSELRWMGYLQSLWVDSQGYIREDTNGNLKLDMPEDRVLVFKLINGETKVRRYDVSIENQYPNIDTDGYYTIEMKDILPIWEAGKVLLNTSPSERNILTSPSGSKDDLIEFTTDHLDSVKYLLGVSDADIDAFPDANIDLLGADLDTRAQTLMDYIRGTDAPGLRNRTFDGIDLGGEDGVWKLGDIVYSTPVSVSKPVELYHHIYQDPSYGDYFTAYKNRQTVVYAGSNDGMLHAFSSWQYDRDTNTFIEPLPADKYGTQGNTIGDELWAYIPRSVLPHLKWLSDPEYAHTYYVDLTPRIFDAKIAGPGQDRWGTFLLLGLNMGGKDIEVDSDGNPATGPENFKPTYTLLDITVPNNPKLVWERTYEGLGMSRSMPAVIKIGGYHHTKLVDGTYMRDYEWVDTGRPEQWLAVFGSGPQGDLAYQGISDQPGRVYVVDLKTGAPLGGGPDYLFTLSDNAVVNSLVSLDKGLNYEVNVLYLGESIKADPADPGSDWTGRAWTIDTYLDWNGVDAWGNKNPDYWEVTNDPAFWHLHLLAEEFTPDPLEPPIKFGPISAPMALSLDKYDNVWVYFGTGRYIAETDKTDTAPQHLFGIKDPLFHNAREYGFSGICCRG